MKLTKDEVRIIIEHCGNDGHSILSPKALDGVNQEFVKKVTQHYSSDGTPKGNIYGGSGEVLTGVDGIYTLDVLARACSILGLKSESAMGRGFQARHYTSALVKYLEEK
jgi:hypothetical protein